MKIAFITNFCPHYRVKTFELLARRYDIDFYFFSAGDDWYYQQAHGARSGRFHHQYLRGVRVAGTRITPGLPAKLFRGGYDVYIKCINGRFALPVTYLAARLRRKPFVLWTGVWTRLQSPVHRMLFPLTRAIYRGADAVVVYGEHVRQYLVREGVNAGRVFVAPHAVDNEFYRRDVSPEERRALTGSLDLPPSAVCILYLGRLEPIKGLSFLIDAFARLDNSDAFLVLAGDGSAGPELRQQVERLGLSSRVRFAGYVPPESAPAFYAIASALVLPSVSMPTGKELWGLVVNEAMNQGVPVIATSAVGAAAGGLVRDGANGFIVPERDEGALAQAMDRLTGDSALRKTLSAGARAAVDEWSNERMVDGFGRAIDHVAG